MRNFFMIILILSIGSMTKAQSWSPMGNLNMAVKTMLIDTATNTLYVGGNPGVAKWNGTSWQTLGSLSSGIVTSLTIYKGSLYAGGNLPSNGNIVKWTGTTWTTVTTGTSGPVGAICVYNNKLVVTGSFITSGGVTTYGFANWDGTSWSNFGAGYPYNPSGSSILTLKIFNGQLYAAGGQLSMLTVDPYSCIGVYNGSAWADASGGAGLSMASVYALEMFNNKLYAGGSFSAAKRIAKWNGSAFVPVKNGMDSTVFALLPHDSSLFAGGAFILADGNTARYIAEWDTISWTEPGGGMGVIGNAPFVFALINYNNCLIAGGQFTTAGGNSIANIAEWCGTTTGTEEGFTTYTTDIFPNPFSASTTLCTAKPLINASLTVYNSVGQAVKRIDNLSGTTVLFHRDNLPSGLYFVRLTAENKIVAAGKLVITDK